MHNIVRGAVYCVLFLYGVMCADTLDVRAYKNRAENYTQKEEFSNAITMYQCILHNNHHDEDALFNLAGLYLKIGDIDNALAYYDTIVSQNPHNIAALYNIGYTYKTAGYIDRAIGIYNAVLQIAPLYDPAHLALGFAYLNKGDFKRGWEQHSRYLKKAKKNGDTLRELLRNGTIANKRILCTYEGGIGDTFMFIRYVALLKELGAYTICLVQKATLPLLAHCSYIDELYKFDTTVPVHDASSSLMSLPAIFNSTEDTIPCTIPYMFPEESLILYWQSIVARTEGFKIGLCWQSDVHNDSSRLPIARRGIPLTFWVSLLRSPDVHVYSLQCLDGVEQIAMLPENCRIHVFDSMDTVHGNFMDSAALIMQMDLIISIDSAVAHLAGALGKPVLLLLPYAVDWRWIYGRSNSPWYPTMTIFKQPKPFDWKSVVDDVHTHLQLTYGIFVQ